MARILLYGSMLFSANTRLVVMSDAPFHSLDTEADWTNALEQSTDTPVLVFKHSSTCPVSGNANMEMTELAEEDLVPIYRVVVQENRAVSDAIASELDVRHETPQAILVHEEEPVYDTSHFNVIADTLREELRRHSLSTT